MGIPQCLRTGGAQKSARTQVDISTNYGSLSRCCGRDFHLTVVVRLVNIGLPFGPSWVIVLLSLNMVRLIHLHSGQDHLGRHGWLIRQSFSFISIQLSDLSSIVESSSIPSSFLISLHLIASHCARTVQRRSSWQPRLKSCSAEFSMIWSSLGLSCFLRFLSPYGNFGVFMNWLRVKDIGQLSVAPLRTVRRLESLWVHTQLKIPLAK